MPRMTGGDAIVDSLLRHGIDTIFGLPGVQMYGLFDAFARNANRLKVINARHEQTTAYMALGYAQSSGNESALSAFLSQKGFRKDEIKSGGEWISSIDLENIAVGHPDVFEAAVIGVAHPKWDERPLLIIVRKPDCVPSNESILNYMADRIAKWWMPDDVVFVAEIPHTATGKIQKMVLRERFKDYQLTE